MDKNDKYGLCADWGWSKVLYNKIR